jgi:hypothetical protein
MCVCSSGSKCEVVSRLLDRKLETITEIVYSRIDFISTHNISDSLAN